MLLSIVVNMYNTARYMSRCMDSLLHQDISADLYPLFFIACGVYALITLVFTVDMPVLTAEDREAFARWNQAKAEKDFARADEYRQILSAKGLL